MRFLAVLVALALAAGCTTTGSRMGEKVNYAPSQFHIEIVLAKNGELVQKILKNEDNPVMAAKIADRRKRGNFGLYKVSIPESRHYDIWSGIENGMVAFSQNACTFDVTIVGINPARVGSTRFLRRGMLLAGEVTPTAIGTNSIRYQNLTIREVSTLVLPMGEGLWQQGPVLTLQSKNCRIYNPGSDGRTVSFAMGHRTAPNGHETRPNKAILVAVLTD